MIPNCHGCSSQLVIVVLFTHFDWFVHEAMTGESGTWSHSIAYCVGNHYDGVTDVIASAIMGMQLLPGWTGPYYHVIRV